MIINKQAKREAKQLFRLCLGNGLLEEDRVRQVVRDVFASDRRNCSAVLAHFLRLIKQDQLRHTARVESAMLLPADLQTVTRAGLTRHYGPNLITTFAERPSLIGGMRIQVGDDVYDGSVQAALVVLEKSF